MRKSIVLGTMRGGKEGVWYWVFGRGDGVLMLGWMLGMRGVRKLEVFWGSVAIELHAHVAVIGSSEAAGPGNFG